MDLEYKILEDTWLQVWRKDGTDGISWDELQHIKNLAFGAEATAVEIFPPMSQLVNIKNIRHLWLVLPDCKLPNLREILFRPRDETSGEIKTADTL